MSDFLTDGRKHFEVARAVDVLLAYQEQEKIKRPLSAPWRKTAA